MGIPRKVRQIAVGLTDGPLFALADDGSLWWMAPARGLSKWQELEPLPQAEGCGAKHHDHREPCQLPAGHREPQHWNGHRRWG